MPDQIRADLILFSLRLMRGAAKRKQDRAPGSAWVSQLDRWIEIVPAVD